MPTAEYVFRDGSDSRKTMLKAAWPELFEALGGTGDEPAEPRRTMYCPHSRHLELPVDERPPVVARLRLNGEKACRECVARYCARPGGYPLALTRSEDFK